MSGRGVAILIVLAPMACTESSSGAAIRPDVAWITHQVGAYAIPPHDLARAAASGIRVSITAPEKRPRTAKEPDLIIDPTVSGIVAAAVPVACQKTRDPCVVPSANRRIALGKVKAHLRSLKSERRVRAIYVIDDYPGNVPSLLRDVRRLVEASNREQHTRRAIMCPFLAPLDTVEPGKPAVAYHDFLDRALLNYSPQVCDIVAAYSYSAMYVPADNVDWTMATLLPHLKSRLLQLGWDPLHQPLVGIPQAFGQGTDWFPPSPDQLGTEIGAFCRGGATAIVGFEWGSSDAGIKGLGNDESLRDGFLSGARGCREFWRSAGPARSPVTAG